MKQTLKILNQLESDGVIKKYVIGGGVAVLFYSEPVLTYDLDIFCILSSAPGSIVTLSPIYDYLKALGYEPKEEQIIIDGVPVQFIPAYNKLVEDAVENAKDVEYEGVKSRVVKLEYLLAIMLDTNRSKDLERINMLLGLGTVDMSKLNKVISGHGLLKKWAEFKKKYSVKE